MGTPYSRQFWKVQFGILTETVDHVNITGYKNIPGSLGKILLLNNNVKMESVSNQQTRKAGEKYMMYDLKCPMCEHVLEVDGSTEEEALQKMMEEAKKHMEEAHKDAPAKSDEEMKKMVQENWILHE